jgi:hypothetical protein
MGFEANIVRKFGLFSKIQQMKYFAIILAICLSLIIISASFYHIPFNFYDVCISNLGNPGYNPKGWWLFTLACVSAGIFLIPYFQFHFLHFEPNNAIVMRIVWSR